MRCAACNRPIFSTPTATIASRNGPLFYGPVCSRRLGLTPGAMKRAARLFTTSTRRPRPDARQFDLFATEIA